MIIRRLFSEYDEGGENNNTVRNIGLATAGAGALAAGVGAVRYDNRIKKIVKEVGSPNVVRPGFGRIEVNGCKGWDAVEKKMGMENMKKSLRPSSRAVKGGLIALGTGATVAAASHLINKTRQKRDRD